MLEKEVSIRVADLDYKYIGSLVELAIKGSSDAFAELYAATYQKQYQFSYCYLKDEFLAQDALQETYVTALKNLRSLNDPKLFVSWLNQINFRVCYSMNSKQKRYNLEMDEFNDEMIGNVRSESPTPEEDVVRIDDGNYVLKQVLALPYTESQVIFLHYYKEMKLDEIAYLLELSKATVKRYLASGKKRLSKSLAI